MPTRAVMDDDVNLKKKKIGFTPRSAFRPFTLFHKFCNFLINVEEGIKLEEGFFLSNQLICKKFSWKRCVCE